MFVNCTPHDIHVQNAAGEFVTIERSGTVARCAEERQPVGEINGVTCYTVRFGEVYDLPERQEGVHLIVSMAVRAALPYRDDLLSPGELVRDEGGKPIGCKGFAVNQIQ